MNSEYDSNEQQIFQCECPITTRYFSKNASFDVGNTKGGNARTILKFADVKIVPSHIDASKTVD